MGVVYNQRELNFETYGYPGLVFDFARAGNQRDGVSKRTDYISIGRNTTGTYVNSVGIITTAAAFEPRFDYDPTSLKCNGLLIEESRINYNTNSIGSNLISSPPKLFQNFGFGSFTMTAGTNFTLWFRTNLDQYGRYWIVSFYLYKTNENQINSFSLSASVFSSTTTATTTLDGITLSTSGQAGTSVSIQNLGNNLYKLVATARNGTAGAQPTITLRATGTFSGGEKCLVSHIQAEAGTVSNLIPSSYIPTTTVAVTRAADNPIITSPNFYNPSTSSIILQYRPSAGIVTTSQPLLSFDDNTTNNEIKVSVAGTSPTLTVVNAGVTTVSISTNPRVTVESQEYGVSLSTKDNQFTLTSEGVGIVTATSGSLPTGITTVRLGHDNSGNVLNGHISKLIYYPRELTTPALKVFSDVSYQGKIVTDGLVLHLDAGNTKSYPGSGTVWYDRAGTNNGTLTNGPTYSSANGGSIVFDGTDDRVVITNNELARIGTGNHTITAWVNNNIVTEEDFIGTDGTGDGSVLLMIFYQAGGGAGGFRGHAWSSTGNSNTIDSPRAIGTGNWNMLTQRVSWGGNIDLFENGVLTKSQVLSGGAPTSSRTKFIIGSRADGGGSSHFDGRIANVQVYNRALTASEISQNFNALRSRFSI